MSRQTSHEDDCLTCSRLGRGVTFHSYNPPPGNRCEVDDKLIEVMAFKGTGVCSEICRKVRDGERLGTLESRTIG